MLVTSDTVSQCLSQQSLLSNNGCKKMVLYNDSGATLSNILSARPRDFISVAGVSQGVAGLRKQRGGSVEHLSPVVLSPH